MEISELAILGLQRVHIYKGILDRTRMILSNYPLNGWLQKA